VATVVSTHSVEVEQVHVQLVLLVNIVQQDLEGAHFARLVHIGRVPHVAIVLRILSLRGSRQQAVQLVILGKLVQLVNHHAQTAQMVK
jgi:hypothetical protein